MSVTTKSCARIASLALAVGLPAVALAQTATAPQPASATAAQIIVRDATTGELRAPTADEARALQPKQARGAAIAAQPLLKANASGAKGVRLTDEFMSYVVMVRRADGTLVSQEYSSKAEAEAAVKTPAPAAKPATAPTE